MRTISIQDMSPGMSSCNVTCAACATHARPLYVPWEQHAIGCRIRTAALQAFSTAPSRLAGRPHVG